MKRIMILTANMGSCQCGDIRTEVVIDEDNGVIITEPHVYEEENGDFIRGEFYVPYCGPTGLMKDDYVHVVRPFTKDERSLFPDVKQSG